MKIKADAGMSEFYTLEANEYTALWMANFYADAARQDGISPDEKQACWSEAVDWEGFATVSLRRRAEDWHQLQLFS